MQVSIRRLAATCCSFLLVGVSARSIHAQAILEGKVTGTVMSEDNSLLPGATVEIEGPALLAGKRSTTTSARGTYVFLNLPVGKYRITASRDAFRTVVQENVEVSAAAVVTIDMVLHVGAVQETVTITAESPIVDTKTSTVDSKIDHALLEKIPTSRDAFLDLALTTPGMSPGSGAPTQTTEFQSPTAYSSATNENVFLINGVDATNPRAGSFGALVNVNYDTVEEVRIVALGSRAEYGSFSGAAIDVLTKSGSNDYHGSVAFYSKLGSVSNNQPGPGEDLGASFLYVGEGEQLAGEVQKDWEGAFTIGGPIVKDRLWFFTAFDYVRSASLPPRWPLKNESWGRYADAKISAAPFKDHRAWVAYHYENNDGNGWSWGSQPGWDTTMTYGSKQSNNTVSAQWQWLSGSKTTVSGKWLGFWTKDKPYVPEDHPDNPGYVNWWKWSEYGISGAFPYVEGYQSSRNTLQADVSHYAEGFLGEHDIKFGVQYTKGRSNSQGGYFQGYINYLYPYRWTQSVQYMQSWYGDTGLMFYNQRDTINPFLTVRTADSAGGFFDDQWTPTRRLTVNLGLRYDQMTAKYGVGKVYQFPSTPTAINDPPPVLRDRASTGNIFDFKTWSPRIGLTYQLTEDGKTVARASFGRYYTPLNAETLRRYGPDMPLKTRVFQFFEVGPWSAVDTNGDGMIDAIETRNAARLVHGLTPISETEPVTIDPSWTLNVADGVKDQYTDQFTLNFEREVAKNLSVAATYIYKRSADLFAQVPINRETGQQWEYERIPFQTFSGQSVQLYSVVLKDYDGNGVVDADDIAWIDGHGTSQVQNLTSFDGTDVKRNFHGFQLVMKKRYSDRWQGLASVVYSTSEGIARRPARQDQSFNVETPEFYDDNWMGNLNYTINNLEGPLPFTPEWEFKASGSYTIPKLEVDFGARFRFMTGRPMWRLEGYPQRTQFGDPPGGVIIPGGTAQIVAIDPNNPDYLPKLALLDLHLEKAFKLGGRKELHAVIDGFNMFNTNTPTDMDIQFEYGKVTSIPQGRRFRLGARFQF